MRQRKRMKPLATVMRVITNPWTSILLMPLLMAATYLLAKSPMPDTSPLATSVLVVTIVACMTCAINRIIVEEETEKNKCKHSGLHG